jgi:hypothetical protein
MYGERVMRIGIWYGILKERDHLEDLSIDGTISTRIFKMWNSRHGLD